MADTRVRAFVGVGVNILEQYVADYLARVPRRRLRTYPCQLLAIYPACRTLLINSIRPLSSRILGSLSIFSPETSAGMIIE